MRTIKFFAKALSAAGLFFLVVHASAREDVHYLEKSLGAISVKLPKLDEFAPACEENAQFAQRAAGMTPGSVIFLTCFVNAKKWNHLLKSGKTDNLSPIIVVAVQHPQPGGDYTLDEFKKIQALAHKHPRYLYSDHENFHGFFEPPGAPLSFSYVVSQSASIEEKNVTPDLYEIKAISSVFFFRKTAFSNCDES